MKLKLARTTLKAKPKTIELKKLEDELANRSIFYFGCAYFGINRKYEWICMPELWNSS